MSMKIKKLNNGSFQLGKQPKFEYWVEAPVREESTYKVEQFHDRRGQVHERMVSVTSGKKLRSQSAVRAADGTWGPNPNEPEPKVWHLYKMKHFARDDAEKTTLEVLDRKFVGTAAEAIAACEVHKLGG